MRDYAKVSPKFWFGATGRELKKRGPDAVIVGLYLLTCQHSNMLGMYYLSREYIAIDTGLGLEGASKGLQSACEAGFCRYDEASEVVWVMEMAAYQIGEQLDEKDNRCKGVQREYDGLPENPFLSMFYERYAQAFHMQFCRGATKGLGKGLTRTKQAPTKPRTGAGEGTGERNTSSPAGSVREFPPGFDAFWSAYPRHTSKAAAAKAYARLKPDEALQQRMLAAVKATSWPSEAQFIPHASTWINGRRWEDEAPPKVSGSDIFAGAV